MRNARDLSIPVSLGLCPAFEEAKKEGYPVSSQSHFLVRQDELGLVDSKNDAELCPNCHRY
jgi:hypothetical protein